MVQFAPWLRVTQSAKKKNFLFVGPIINFHKKEKRPSNLLLGCANRIRRDYLYRMKVFAYTMDIFGG